MSGEALTIVFLMLVLKLPIVGLAYIIWFALRKESEALSEQQDEGGSGGGNDRIRDPQRPVGPRRGPGAVPPRPVPEHHEGIRPRRSPRPSPRPTPHR